MCEREEGRGECVCEGGEGEREGGVYVRVERKEGREERRVEG